LGGGANPYLYVGARPLDRLDPRGTLYFDAQGNAYIAPGYPLASSAPSVQEPQPTLPGFEPIVRIEFAPSKSQGGSGLEFVDFQSFSPNVIVTTTKCKFVSRLLCLGAGRLFDLKFPYTVAPNQACTAVLVRVCDAEPGECRDTFLGAP